MQDDHKAPFPYMGGKTGAAETIWAALGDVEHYVEPFCGSLAVLLNRPHTPNRTYYSETVNDADGLLVNAWRSIQLHPEETAAAASNLTAEADLHARHIALVRWRAETQLERLMCDPKWCDPEMGGWWLWGISSWIGGGWGAGTGPWTNDPTTGRITKQPDKQREPGVRRQRPHISSDGQGVTHPVLREPGVVDATAEPRPVTMPKLITWFRLLAARLRHVRVLNGDWARTCTTGALQTLHVRNGGTTGIFLDPPYADTADRSAGLYAHDSGTIAHDVAEWCLSSGTNPKYRIVLAGFDREHGTNLLDAGWTEFEWFKSGFLTGGLGNIGQTGHQQRRERLWASPTCLDVKQLTLFDGA